MAIKKTDYSEVKRINRNAVYNYLYGRDAQSKQDIAYALRISLPTVTQNVRELLQMGLVIETGEFESTGGRKARAIEINYSARCAIGLDVTKQHIGIVLIDMGCKVIHFQRIRLPFENRKEYFAEVGRLIDKTVEESGVEVSKILGVGIGVPAIVTADHQSVTYSPILGFTGGTLQSFSEYIPYPCVLNNDANSGGYAEIWNSPKKDNMLYLSVSNSIGGAILLNGDLIYGNNQRAGEFGHITVRPDGPRCYCGKDGCLDALCNTKVLTSASDGSLDTFFQQLNLGNVNYRMLWEEYLDNMATAINIMRMSLDCDIVIGGYLGSYMEDYIDQLRKKVSKRNTFEPDGSYLSVCTYKFEATAVGNALLFVKDFIENI